MPVPRLPTALQQASPAFRFCIAGNADVVALVTSGAATNSTEVHILSAEDQYRRFVEQTGTALHPTGDDFDFVLSPQRHLYAIKKRGTGSNSTEIHVLSAESRYREFTLHTGTCLPETGPEFVFLLAPNLDLVAIKKRSTGTESTEVHIVSAASGYQTFSVQTGTALHETDDTFEFAMDGDRNLLAIQKRHTSSGTTEIHVLSASSGYQQFSLRTATELDVADDSVVHGLASGKRLLSVRWRGGASGQTEVQVVTVPEKAVPQAPAPVRPVAGFKFGLPSGVIDAGQAQQRTLWLPEDGQTADVGALSASIRREWITLRVGNQRGVLGRSEAATLPAGDYHAIVQLYHKQNAGKSLGEIRLRDGAGAVIATSEVVSAVFPKFENGGFQRATIDFNVPEGDGTARTRQVEFFDFHDHFVWLGAISVRPKDTPFYVMAHHANARAKAERLMTEGARVVEVDIHPDAGNPEAVDYAIWAIHFAADEFSDALHTKPAQIDAYFSAIGTAMVQGRLDLLVLDCKATLAGDIGAGLPVLSQVIAESRKYGRSLARLMIRHGIPASRVVMGYDEDKIEEMARGAAELDYRCGVDVYRFPTKAARNFTDIQAWTDALVAKKCLFADIGTDERVRGEFFTYAYWIAGLLRVRDEGTQIKKAYFWTVNNEQDMRNALDYGIDGILTDDPAKLVALLEESPYAGVYRLSTPQDSQFVRALDKSGSAQPKFIA